LAALDDMMAASRAALREAPQDPLLNHYFLSAWAAREATLQQLGAALPVDKLVERY
jgi:phosphopantetheinyl transferase